MAYKPINHYKDNRETYSRIRTKLDLLREDFLEADKRTQRRLLLDSYIFAAISVQTPLDIHEQAFHTYIRNGRELDNSDMKKVNYWKNKTQYIRETETKFVEIDAVIDLLQRGKIDAAHRKIADEFKGVSTKKAGFTLAMLGFTEKMCIDTNVRQMAGIPKEQEYEGVVISKYEAQCKEIRDSFNELDEEVSPFMVQWVLFDSIRESVTTHKEFLNHMLQQV